MSWERVKVSDDRLRGLRDRHYAGGVGGRTVGQPGRKLAYVIERPDGLAGWVSHWPDPTMAFHGYGDRFICTLYRKEFEGLSSPLIMEAVELTETTWGAPPDGWLTFVDCGKVAHKRDPGRCFRRAGFVPIGITKYRRLLVLGR